MQFKKVLKNNGISPTIKYTIEDYKPDDVTIGVDISGGKVQRYETGPYVVKDNIVVAFTNGSKYDKVVNS